MVQMTEIQNAVAAILKEKTSCKVYKNEVIEGFKAPCFFVAIRISEFEPANKYTVSVKVECAIEYFPYLPNGKRVRSEIQIEKLMSEMPLWFSPNIHVGDRFLVTDSGNFRLVGENADILQYVFSISYFDCAPDDEGDSEKITQVNVDAVPKTVLH